MVRSASVESSVSGRSGGEESQGKHRTLEIHAVAPYLLLLNPRLWDITGDPYAELELFKHCSKRLVRNCEDKETVQAISELSVWTAACPRDTSRPARERMRDFAAKHLGGHDEAQLDELYELAINTQAQLWGNCLKEPAYNLTRMCDAVAKETGRIIDNALGCRGKAVRVENVTLAVTKLGEMTERGMELHVVYDSGKADAKDVHLAIDRLYSGAIYRAAEDVFMQPLQELVPQEEGEAIAEEEEEESKENPRALLIRMAELYWRPEDKDGNVLPVIRSAGGGKLESPMPGEGGLRVKTRTVRPDCLQKALLADNLSDMRKVIRRAFKTDPPEAIFTTCWDDDGPITSPFMRNMQSPVRSLGATCPPQRAGS